MSIISYCSTWQFNIVCALLHLASTIAMVVLSVDPNKGRVVLTLGDIDTTWWTPSVFSGLALFSGITAAFHCFYAYLIRIGNIGSMRFLEYSITASIMAVIIAILCRIDDIFTLTGIAGLMMTTMVFGYLEDILPFTGDKSRLMIKPFWLGCIPYLFAWVIISWSFFAEINHDVPHFVIAIFFIEFFMFSCFALVQYIYVVREERMLTDEEVLTMDGWYNLLSLTSKLLLVWICFGGIESNF